MQGSLNTFQASGSLEALPCGTAGGNRCSERRFRAALVHGMVASFPLDSRWNAISCRAANEQDSADIDLSARLSMAECRSWLQPFRRLALRRCPRLLPPRRLRSAFPRAGSSARMLFRCSGVNWAHMPTSSGFRKQPMHSLCSGCMTQICRQGLSGSSLTQTDSFMAANSAWQGFRGRAAISAKLQHDQ